MLRCIVLLPNGGTVIRMWETSGLVGHGSSHSASVANGQRRIVRDTVLYVPMLLHARTLPRPVFGGGVRNVSFPFNCVGCPRTGRGL